MDFVCFLAFWGEVLGAKPMQKPLGMRSREFLSPWNREKSRLIAGAQA